MSFFPSPEPLADSPDPSRYERHLLCAAGDGSSSALLAGWSVEDAAAFWLPAWRKAGSGTHWLPADSVMGLVTRAFVALTGELPLIGRLFATLGYIHGPMPARVGPYRGISAHSICYAAHVAFAPAAESISEQLRGTGFRALAEKQLSRCNMPDCEESESLVGHCLPRAAFDGALRSGFLLPARGLEPSPLALLMPQLECWSRSLPYIAVRDHDDHFKHLVCPYWVHDAITNLARIVPRLMVDPDTQALVRATATATVETLIRNAQRLDEHQQRTRLRPRVRDIFAEVNARIWHLHTPMFPWLMPNPRPKWI